ncbi:hypothetical protein DDN40_05100 [Vibrio cholerae]|nr:hypothetical protein [Vibrio cholerae]
MFALFVQGRGSVRKTVGQAGKGCLTKRRLRCNDADRGSNFALTRKGAKFRLVFNRVKTWQAVLSTTPTGERYYLPRGGGVSFLLRGGNATGEKQDEYGDENGHTCVLPPSAKLAYH